MWPLQPSVRGLPVTPQKPAGPTWPKLFAVSLSGQMVKKCLLLIHHLYFTIPRSVTFFVFFFPAPQQLHRFRWEQEPLAWSIVFVTHLSCSNYMSRAYWGQNKEEGICQTCQDNVAVRNPGLPPPTPLFRPLQGSVLTNTRGQQPQSCQVPCSPAVPAGLSMWWHHSRFDPDWQKPYACMQSASAWGTGNCRRTKACC